MFTLQKENILHFLLAECLKLGKLFVILRPVSRACTLRICRAWAAQLKRTDDLCKAQATIRKRPERCQTNQKITYMRKHLLCFWMVLLTSMTTLTAQTIVLSESFENGIPSTWSQEQVSGQVQWTTESSDLLRPSGAASGNARAAFRNSAGESEGAVARLITPVMNLDTVDQPILRYYHAQAKWTADIDTLRVYYRTSSSANWVLLQEFVKPIASWTKEQLDLPQPSATYQLCFEGSENMGRGIVLDSVVVRAKPVCTLPSGLTLTNVQDSAATLTWQASYDVDDFRVLLLATNEVLDIDTIDIAQAKADQLILLDTIIDGRQWQYRFTHLPTKQNYVAYVSSLCEMENSDWVNYSFYMKALTPLPYIQDFNLPQDGSTKHRIESWTYGTNTTYYTPYINTNMTDANVKQYVRSGRSLCFVGNNTTSLTTPLAADEYAYAALPEILVDDIRRCQVRFWGSVGANGCSNTYARGIIIGIADDPEDISTFIPVDTLTVRQFATYEEHITSFAEYEGEGKTIVFLSRFDQPNMFFIDDIEVSLIPASQRTLGVHVNPQDTTAAISWAATGSAYTVLISSAAEADPSAPVSKVLSADVQTNNYEAKGLASGKEYYLYIRTDGGDWTEATVFSTAYVRTLPVTFNFDETADRVQRPNPNGTTTTAVNYPKEFRIYSTAANPPYIYTTTSYNNNKSAGSLCFNMPEDRESWVVLPVTNDTAINGLQLEFWMRAYNTSYVNTQIVVGVMTDPSDMNTFVEVERFQQSTTTYKRFYTNFASYQGAGRYIAIRGLANTAGGAGSSYRNVYAFIDDIVVSKMSACVMPRFTQAKTTTDSVALAWSADGMDKFKLIVATDSLGVLESAALDTVSGAYKSVLYYGILDTTGFSLNNLHWGRKFYAYAQSQCEEGKKSEWSKPIAFATAVPEAIELPYIENFDYFGTGAGTMAAGWSIGTLSTTYPQVSTSSKYQGYAGLYLYNATTTKGGWAIAPELATDDLSKIRISFWAKAAYTASATYPDSLYIGVVKSAEDSVATWLDTIKVPTTTFTYYSTVLSNWTPQMGNRIVFNTYHPSKTNTLHLDNIAFELLEGIQPYEVDATDIAAENATITWKGESENGWQVVVTTEAIRPDTLANVAESKIVVNETTQTRPYSFSGLSAQTHYFIYVRPVGGSDAVWSEEYEILTACKKLKPSMSYLMNFEDIYSTTAEVSGYAAGVVPECWTRHTTPESGSYTSYMPIVHKYKDGATTTTNVHSGLAALKLAATASYGPSWVATPELDTENMESVTVDLWGYPSGSATQYAILGVMSDPDDYGTFTPLTELQPGVKVYTHYSIILGDYGYDANSEEYKGKKYIAFSTPAAQTTFYIDDIQIYETTCRPATPRISKLASDSVRVAYFNSPIDARILLVADTTLDVETLEDEEAKEAYLAELKAGNYIVMDSLREGGQGIVLRGLKPDTYYTVATQAQCEEGKTAKWQTATFTTPCAPLSVAPFETITFEDYESSTSTAPSSRVYVSCWTTGNMAIGAGNGQIPYVMSGTAAPSGEKALYFYTNSSYKGAYAVMPALDVDSINKMQLNFKARAGNTYSTPFTKPTSITALSSSYAGAITVGVLTDLSDFSTFVPVDTLSFVDNDVHDAIVRFDSYKGDQNEEYGKHIMFYANFPQSYDVMLIDDIDISPITNCGAPNKLRADEIGADSAVLSWKGVTDSYRVVLSTEKLEAERLETYANYVLNDTVDTISYIARNINGLTTYYAYVKGICEDGTGVWFTDGIAFTTGCPDYLTLPYEEDFDRYASGAKNHPDCWKSYYNGTVDDDATYPQTYSSAKYGTSGNGLYLYNLSTYKAEDKRATTATPAIGGKIGNTMLSFVYKSSSSVASPTALLVGIASDVSTLDSLLKTVVYIDTLRDELKSNTNWHEYSRTLEGYEGENMHIVLTTDYAAANHIYLDNFKIEKTPTCFVPKAATIDSIGTTSVRVVITPYSEEDSAWDIAFITKSGDTTLTVTADSTTYIANGLQHTTDYKYVVRTNCGGGDVSEWTAPQDFNTAYVIGDGMYYGFEITGDAANELKPIPVNNSYSVHRSLTVGENGTTYTYTPYQVASSATSKKHRSGNAALQLYTNATYTHAWVGLPEIAGADTLQLRLDFRNVSSVSGGDTILETSTYPFTPLQIGTIDAGGDISSFQPIGVYYASAKKLGEQAKEAQNLLFDQVVVPLAGVTADKQVVIANLTPKTSYIFVDNLYIEKAQGYKTPAIGKSTITPTTLTLHWEADGNTKWNVYLTQDVNAFPIDSVEEALIVAQKTGVTETSVTFEGLTPDATYYAYLQVADAEGLGATSPRRAYRMPVGAIAERDTVGFELTSDNKYYYYPNSAAKGDTLYQNIRGYYSGSEINTTRLQQPFARPNGFGATANTKTSPATVSRTGDYALQLYSNTTDPEGLGVYAALPEVAVDYDTVEVSLWARPYFANASSQVGIAGTTYKNKPLIVGTMTDPNNAATFAVIDTFYYSNITLTTSTNVTTLDNNGWENFRFRLSGAEGKYIAFAAPVSGQWYIDDITFGEYTCLRPLHLQAANITGHTADLSWNTQNEGAQTVVQVATAQDFAETSIVWTDTVETRSATATGLVGLNRYYWRARQLCSEDEQSQWSLTAEFTTECQELDMQQTISFEASEGQVYLPGATSSDYLQPQCWTVTSNDVDYAATLKYYSYPQVKNATTSTGYGHTGNSALLLKGQYRLPSGSTVLFNYDQLAVMPELGECDMDTVQMVFYIRPSEHSLTSGLVSSIRQYGFYIPMVEVGLMTDPSDTTTFTPIQEFWYTRDSLTVNTPANAGNEYMYQQCILPLKGWQGKGNYIAFRTRVEKYFPTLKEERGLADNVQMQTYLFIDDISFEKLNECYAPEGFNVSGITLSDATLSWEAGEDDVKYKFNLWTGEGSDVIAIITDSVLDQASITVHELDTFTTYYWTVATICGEESESQPSLTNTFHTLRTPRFDEHFTTNTSLPEDWVRSSTSADDVFSGTAMTYSSSSTWTRQENPDSYGMEGPHMRIYVNITKAWLITPELVMDSEKDAWLTFNAALTLYTTGEAPKYANDPDDRFIVAISEDGGATWKRENATIWNNTGDGDYSFAGLPVYARRESPIRIDLSKYKGKNIRVGFYAESTEGHTTSDYTSLHIGNVHVNYYAVEEETVSLCQYEDAAWDSFEISGDTVPAGKHVYERVVISYKGNQTEEAELKDSLYRFEVNYLEAPQAEYELTICAGEQAGAAYGFNDYTESGTYRRKGTSVVTGCDSITILHLTVLPVLRSEEEVYICAGKSVEFGGKMYSETGVYVDTLQSVVTGCDSIAMLILHVDEPISYAYEVEQCAGVPYYFTEKYPALILDGKYIDTLRTADGCDSIVTLTISWNEAIQYAYEVELCAGEPYYFTAKYPALTTAGVYVDTLQAIAGCDSVVILTLNYREVAATSLEAKICQGDAYYFTAKYPALTETGIYVDTLQTEAGCDSVVTLSLAWYNQDTVRVDTVITDDKLPYFYPSYRAINYPIGTPAGDYEDIVTIEQEEGCPYVLVHHLTILTSEGIDNQNSSGISIAPNVIRQGESVIVKGDLSDATRVEVYDILGRLVAEKQFEAHEAITINTFPVSGIYTVRVGTDNTTEYVGRVVVR